MKVGVIDIGSPKRNNIGWAIVGDNGCCCGKDLDECVDKLAAGLRAGPLALGFEAPMFVPMREKAKELTEARCGERTRAFSATAGATVLVTATVVVPYVLAALRKAVPDAKATMKWEPWQRQEAGCAKLLLFEAFVSGKSKKQGRTHEEDATSAAQDLYGRLLKKEPIEPAVTVDKGFNILGAMMIRTEWECSSGVLSEPCLVVKPDLENLGAAQT